MPIVRATHPAVAEFVEEAPTLDRLLRPVLSTDPVITLLVPATLELTGRIGSRAKSFDEDHRIAGARQPSARVDDEVRSGLDSSLART
jgi:hypothetical protein